MTACRWLLCVAVLAATALAGCAPADTLPGKLTLAAYYVPPDMLEKMAAGKPRDAFGTSWASPNTLIETASNPHRLVVDFEGELKGDIATAENLFEITWLIRQDEQSGGPLQMVRFAKENLQVQGHRVKGRAVTPPLSFTKPDQAALSVQLVRHASLSPTKVTLTVRGGMDGTSWVQMLLSFQSLLVGLVFLGLVLWLRRFQ